MCQDKKNNRNCFKINVLIISNYKVRNSCIFYKFKVGGNFDKSKLELIWQIKESPVESSSFPLQSNSKKAILVNLCKHKLQIKPILNT